MRFIDTLIAHGDLEGYSGNFSAGGPVSSVVSATTQVSVPPANPVTLNVPGGLKATWDASGNTQANHHSTISWQNGSDNEGGFQLERSTDPNFPAGAMTVVLPMLAADQTTYNDLSPDYDHVYYYRVRAVATTLSTTTSGWSGAVSLSPGAIIVMFYGADFGSALRSGSNRDLQAMYTKLVNAGYQIKGFQGLSIGADPVQDAEQWILDNIGQAHPGTYDPRNGDVSRNIEIIGYSVGGADVAYLANKILYDTRFHDEIVSLAIAVDPVTRYTSGDATIPGTVLNFWNLIETHDLATARGAFLFYPHINGVFIPSNAQINHYFDVTTDYGPLRNTVVDHIDFITDEMFTFLIGLLKGNQQ